MVNMQPIFLKFELNSQTLSKYLIDKLYAKRLRLIAIDDNSIVFRLDAFISGLSDK